MTEPFKDPGAPTLAIIVPRYNEPETITVAIAVETTEKRGLQAR